MVKRIDCGVRIAVDVAARLPERWRRHVETFGRRAAPSLTAVAAPTQPPIDWSAVEMAVLLPTTDAADQQNLELAAAMARAANDVQAAKWLDGDSRLRGSIVVAYEDADMAVEEIDRRAPDRRFVQLLLPPIAHAPFGDRRYWPMLAAAERHGLPICLTGEVASHLASFVFGGVFERMPGLRLLTVGTGCAWLPSLIWRLDGSWKLLKDEVPELTRLPSEYVREHLWFDCAPLEAPHLQHILAHLGHDDRIVAAGATPATADAELLRQNAQALHVDHI